MNGGWGISYEIALRWIPIDLTDDKSTLVQVMAWCHQATSHYLSQCWPRFMSPNGVTRPQWVKCWTLWCWMQNFPGELDQCNHCWCPGALHRQVTSSHNFQQPASSQYWEMVDMLKKVYVKKAAPKELTVKTFTHTSNTCTNIYTNGPRFTEYTSRLW